MVKKSRSRERSSRALNELRSSRRSDETLSYANRPYRTQPAAVPMIDTRLLDYVGVYRYKGKLMDFDASSLENQRIVHCAMEKIREHLKINPDYLVFLCEEHSARLKEIPQGPLIQRLAVCTAIWALENGKEWAMAEIRDDASLQEFKRNDTVPVIKDWETAFRFIMRNGVANPLLEANFVNGGGEIDILAKEFDVYSVIPNPGVTDSQLRSFFESVLKDNDFRKPNVMYKAAVAAQQAGLVQLRHKRRKEMPAIKVPD